MTGAGWTTWERWKASLPPRDAGERARYAEYGACRTAPPRARTLPEITALALLAECGECWPGSGKPCDCPDGRMHAARYARALRRGLISDQDMAAVPDALRAFTPGIAFYGQVTA